MSIPNVEKSGELPAGVHAATIKEIEKRFGRSSDRRRLLMTGLKKAIDEFKKVNVKKIYVDGCWVSEGVKEEDLYRC